jgi:ferrochelatase
VLSFHGVPRRTLALATPTTANARRRRACWASALQLEARQCSSPSRAASARPSGCKPYTEPTLVALAQARSERVDVMCPGFSADCLETLEEIDQEAAGLHVGRRQRVPLHPLPERPARVDRGLSALALRHLQGWPTDGGSPVAELARRRDAPSPWVPSVDSRLREPRTH